MAFTSSYTDHLIQQSQFYYGVPSMEPGLSGSFSGSFQGDGSNLTGIVTATDLSSSIFVSPSGNDTTGTVGDLMKPFATLESASQAATTGSTIFVYPGTYIAPAENLAFEGGSYYFHPGTVVSKSAAGPVFNSKNYSVSFNVYGHADFYLTSSCEEVIEAGNSSAPTPSFTFECQDITQLCGGDYAIVATVDNGASTTDIAVANIKFRKLKTDGSGIALPGPYTTEKGSYFINFTEIYADGFGIYSYQGVTNLEINATRIVANGGSGIRTYYGSATNINVAYLYGSTYGFDSAGAGYINLSSAYVSGINNAASVITLNGHCADLDTSGGTFIGGSVEGGTWSGGTNEIVWKPTYTDTITISGGTHNISAGSSTYFPQLNMQGGTAHVDGYNHGYYSNYRYSISGGELIWDGYLDYAIDDNGANYPFDMSGGTLRIRGYVKNQMNDSEPTPNQYSCVYYNGGTLILDGATLITSASAAPPVIVGSQDRVVKILSGGVNTNKTGSLGLLQASSSFSGDRYALTNPLGGMIIEDASVE